MVKKQKRKNLTWRTAGKENSRKNGDLAIGISQSGIKTFLEKFKADVAEKIKKYQEYAQESRKKKKL